MKPCWGSVVLFWDEAPTELFCSEILFSHLAEGASPPLLPCASRRGVPQSCTHKGCPGSSPPSHPHPGPNQVGLRVKSCQSRVPRVKSSLPILGLPKISPLELQ